METTLKYDQVKAEGKHELLGGLITGQIAGLIMAVVVMLVFALFLGKNPLFPVQVIGSTVFGAEALEGINFLAILAGLLLHQLGPSILWGALYGFLASRLNIANSRSALFLGLGVGVVSMFGPYVLIPFIMKTLQGVDYWNQEVPMMWDWAAHLVFGASFMIYPSILHKLNSKN